MNLIRRRHFSRGLFGVGAMWACAASAEPRVPSLRIICSSGSGTPEDLLCRTLADRLGGGRVAWNVLVVNSPGEFGRAAVNLLRRSPPDGSVVLVMPTSNIVADPLRHRSNRSDPLDDLSAALAVAARRFVVAVGAHVPATVTAWNEFVHWARSRRQAVRCGNSGSTSVEGLLSRCLAREGRLAVEGRPHPDQATLVRALCDGHVDIALVAEATVREATAATRLRLLAGSRLARTPRVAAMPLSDGAYTDTLLALLPRAAPRWVVDSMSEGLRWATLDSRFQDACHRLSFGSVDGAPSRLGSQVRAELRHLAPWVRMPELP